MVLNLNSHNKFIYIILHYLYIFEHVTQHLTLNLTIYQCKTKDIKGKYNYSHILCKKVLIFQVFQGKMFDLCEEKMRQPSPSSSDPVHKFKNLMLELCRGCFSSKWTLVLIGANIICGDVLEKELVHCIFKMYYYLYKNL